MTVSVGIKHRESGAYDVIPVATSDAFVAQWLPACHLLGLRFVPRFHDGSLGDVTAEHLGEILEELERLRSWALHTEATFMTVRIGAILTALRRSASEPCDYDFG